MYHHSYGTIQDLEKAFYLYEVSAKLGFGEAQKKLASMYENGEGVKQNPEKAEYWFQQYKETIKQETKNKCQNNFI